MFVMIALSIFSVVGLGAVSIVIRRNRFKESEYNPLKQAQEKLQEKCRDFDVNAFFNVDGFINKSKENLLSDLVIENKSFSDWKKLESDLKGKKNEKSYFVLINGKLNDKKQSLQNVIQELDILKKTNSKYLKMHEDEQEEARKKKRAEDKKRDERRRQDDDNSRLAGAYVASSSSSSSSDSSSSNSDWGGGGGSSSGGGSSDSW